MQTVCSGCHDEAKFEHIVADRKAEVQKLLENAEAAAGPRERRIIDAIRRAGPLHNMDATVKVLTTLAEVTASEASAPSAPR